MNFKIGELYYIRLSDGRKVRALIAGFRPYFEEQDTYLFDLDSQVFINADKNRIVDYKKIPLSVIKNKEVRDKLKMLQYRFSNAVIQEKIYDKELAAISEEYKRVKEKYDNALKKYNEKGVGSYYKIENESSQFILDLVNSGFTLENQNLSKTLSVEEFRNYLWKYINPEIKSKLLSSPRFYLNFEAILNHDDGCFYSLELYRGKILDYSYPLRDNNPIYSKIVDREYNKEDADLHFLNYSYFTPYEKLNDLPLFTHIDYGYGNKSHKTHSNKKRNIYTSYIMRREFNPFPLTEENAKKIAQSIYIYYK